ncbi:MAG: FAD-binding and (Fe-S)-binding domain-containing protein [Rhodospirillaceae bacterium]
MPDQTVPPTALSLPPHAQRELAVEIARRTTAEVLFDAGNRAAYSADASNYRQIPIGVVVPRTVDDVVATMAICRERDVPVLARGGGTSQCGQCVNVAVVIDNSKYLSRVLDIDPQAATARVEPGIVCDALRDAAELHGLTFGPDPATHSRCTLGGMIGNNSCGAHSVMAGKTVENIEALEVLTYDGARMWVEATTDAQLEEIIRAGGRRGEIYARLRALRDRYADLIRAQFPRIKRRVSGYNLDQLLPENGFNVARALVGSEGTCAYTLQAVTRLVRSPPHRVLLILGFRDIYAAGDAVPHVLPFQPIATEGLDERLIGGLRERGLRLADIAALPAGRAWLMIEFGGETPGAAAVQANALVRSYEASPHAPSASLITDPQLCERMWSIRETAASATALSRTPGAVDPTIGWEDAAVDPLRLGDYLREFQALVDRYGYETSLYGHFGDGCIHARITFDLRSDGGVATWKSFLRDAARLVVAYGGSLSGEHGDGQARAEFLPLMYGPELMEAFREFKRIWDPGNRMNPGKLIDAYRVDEHLRLGPDYRPARPVSHFAFRTPEGSGFTRAVERCVGMGKCRSHEGGVMCPSFRATGDERNSTRGRARLLSEMLRGDVIADGWRSDAVREALELCFACKGCKSDCPTHTDMATYKAEFMAHYYAGRRRPVQAYSMGLIHRWARLASRAPRFVNTLTHTPGIAALAKRLAGIAPERDIPRFARRSFREQYAKRASPGTRSERVVLWADTFNDHFHPHAAMAAVRVLEALGCMVVVPARKLCCGRPLYDFGMIELARRQLLDILDALAPEIEAGTPIIGLEPACLSVFRDEMPNLLPDDARAAKLAAQARLFSDFVVTHPRWPKRGGLSGAALVHGHCHQKALFGMDSDLALLRSTGLTASLIPSSCCGMAGSFGFHPQHYAISMKAGEASVLPAVRNAASDTLIVASGYSCREQIEHGAARETVHIAQVAARALDTPAS